MKTIDKSMVTKENLIDKIDSLELKNAELELKLKFYEEQLRFLAAKTFWAFK
jgi:hypothetical protein